MKAFECKMCGDCCFGEGGISISPDEIEKIAGFLGESRRSFVSRVCQFKNARVYIKTGQDGYCLFHNKERGCLIHPVKPDICSLWPFYPALLRDKDNWEMAQDGCPGINREATFKDFLIQSATFSS